MHVEVGKKLNMGVGSKFKVFRKKAVKNVMIYVTGGYKTANEKDM